MNKHVSHCYTDGQLTEAIDGEMDASGNDKMHYHLATWGSMTGTGNDYGSDPQLLAVLVVAGICLLGVVQVLEFILERRDK